MSRKSRPTIADIAQELGVSTATVSRALSGRGYVRDDLLARIRSKAREMNYPLQDAPPGSRVLLVASNAALVDLQRSQFTLHVLEGLKARAERLHIEIEVLGYAHADELTGLPDAVAMPDLIGVIFMTVDDTTIGLARALSCPVVLLNADDPLMAIDSVTPCNRSAAALGAEHLRALGHRRILFLSKPGRRTITRRLEGVRDVLGAELRPEDILEADDWTAEAARDCISAALRARNDFTAIIAAADILAAGAIMAIQESGRSVPGDISVIGIDGLPQGEFLSPALTTVAIPMREIGAEAVDMICEAAQKRRLSEPGTTRRVELACELIQRASTEALAAG